MAEKRKHVFEDSDAENEDDVNGETKKSIPKHIRKEDKRLIVILEEANLETIKNGKNHELLNSEDHHGHLKKYKKKELCRPDITHQCLLMLFDSPLNRAGLLQVYVHTEKNALIEINPQTRIPRTFKRFSGLMVQLLHKLTIRSADGNHRLMKVIKNPVTDHLPVGCRKIATSYKAEKIVSPKQLRELETANDPIVFVVGAMAHGKLNIDYTEETIAISSYPLSAAAACSKLCTAFEEKWGII